jgi:hypothetical protein
MTRTEERLTDALGAAASRLREETLRPLSAPPRRGRRWARWLAPIAATASVLLVLGLVVGLAGRLPGSGRGASAGIAAPHRYYIETDILGTTTVRSTSTGAVTATVPVSSRLNHRDYRPFVASAADGTYYIAAFYRLNQQRIYQFRLTGTGKISGFSPVRGGELGKYQIADAMAASQDGSRLAVGIATYRVDKYGEQDPRSDSDQIAVIRTSTGARSIWQGGMRALGRSFEVASLSWTSSGRELVVLGQWCGAHAAFDHEVCMVTRSSRPGAPPTEVPGARAAEVWALNPASRGGQLDSGRLLLRQSARYPYIAQALISPDGSTITAVLMSGPVIKSKNQGPGLAPDHLSVQQISVATGKQQAVLYQRRIGATSAVNAVPDFLALVADGAGTHLMLNGGICSGRCQSGFNGWIHGGRLIPLQPSDGRETGETW